MTDDELQTRIEVVRPHSEADVLTVAEAAKRLRIRRADCQAWLERLGLPTDGEVAAVIRRQTVAWRKREPDRRGDGA